MSSADSTPQIVPGARVRVAQVLSLVALVGALIGALGPAEKVRTAYAWPPETLPAVEPERLWYTPLLLTQHQPEAISATIPCAPATPLRAANGPVTVLATARSAQSAAGLSVTQQGRELVVSVGDREVAKARTDPSASETCSYRLRMVSGRWSLEGGPRQLARAGPLAEMPVVFGVLSELDLAAGRRPAIAITTAVHGTRTITRQAVAWTVAAIAIVAALLLVAFEAPPRLRSTLRRTAASLRANVHPVDGVVGVTLLGWWVLSPAFFDDGWVITRQSMFSSWRGFSAYYNTFAANSPLSYELDWLLHWLSQSTSELVLLRGPALLSLAVTWVLCRWALSRILDSSVGRSRVALWSLASAFLVGALAWGMTLRTEPVTALIVAGVLVCVIRFLERGEAAPVAALAVLVPVALTTHPEGTASLAPVLVVAPALFVWGRAQPAAATVIGSTAVALFGMLSFLGSDLEQRRADTETTATYGLTAAWRYEFIRYASLADFPWGTPIRRAAVVLAAMAVLALLLWGRRRAQRLLDLPATALGLALVLFVATPSKHPWHFGALIGLAAVAVASETARFRDEAARSDASRARPFLVLVATTFLVAWTWAPRQQWNALDLMTLEWTPSFESLLPIATVAAALPLGLLAAAWLRARVRRQSDRLPQIPPRAASWAAPILAIPLIAFTVGMLVADTAKSSSWTMARQNLDTLRGEGGCGLGDSTIVAVPLSEQASATAPDEDAARLPAWMPDSPLHGLPRFALGPSRQALVSTPWFELADERVGIFIVGTPGPSELEIEVGRRDRRGRIKTFRIEPVPADFVSDLGVGTLPWRFVLPGEIPSSPGETKVLRVTLRSTVHPGAAVAVTAPARYTEEVLTDTVEGSSSRTLVLPNVQTYFPCLPPPRLGDGIVDVPGHILSTRDGAWILGQRTSPFMGVLDLYRLQRLPLIRSDPSQDDLAVLVVDERIPGAEVAPPIKTTVVS